MASRDDSPAMIAVDWGTSHLRACRLGPDGAVLDRRAAPLGIQAVADRDFEAALRSVAADWLAADPGAMLVMGGMVGSRQGWREAPYLPCPASLGDLAGGALPLCLADGRSAWIAPGLSVRRPGGAPDVMRGEEVQILGALDRLGPGRHRLCLPGSHSKWAVVDDGRVVDFSTWMSGELFDVLRRHSILGRMIEHAVWDAGAFAAGLDQAGRGALQNQLFGVRARGLFGELSAEQAGGFLSGLLIGHELEGALAGAGNGPVVLIGEAGLTELYAEALARRGRSAVIAAPDAAARGLYRLARALRQRPANDSEPADLSQAGE